ANVPSIIANMSEYRAWTDPLLRHENESEPADSRQKLHTSLALLPVDSSQLDYLYARLLDAQGHEIPVIRDALLSHKQELVDKLWSDAQQPGKNKESRRLRAACALASYDPDSPRWEKICGPVVEQLVAENPVYLALW